MKKGDKTIHSDSEKSEDEEAERKQQQLPNWLQARPLMGRVLKLSGFGFSTHTRILRLTQHFLCYYSKIPVDFRDQDGGSSVAILTGKEKPKISVPVEYIYTVDEMSIEEKQKNKKLFLNPTDVGFKIVFYKSKQIKGPMPEPKEEADDEKKKKPQDEFVGELKDLEYSYLSLQEPQPDDEVKAVTLDDWLMNISIFAKQKNPNIHVVSERAMVPIDIEIQKKLKEQEKEVLSVKQAQRDIVVPKMPNDEAAPLAKPKSLKKQQEAKVKLQKEAENVDNLINQNININKPTVERDRTAQLSVSLNNEPNQKLLQETKQLIEKWLSKSIEEEKKLTDSEFAGWDLKFQNYWGKIVETKNDFTKNRELSERLICHVGNFRKQAKKVVRKIVDTLHLPEAKRDIHPLDSNKIDTDYKFFVDECMDKSTRMIYHSVDETKNIIIKLTHQADFEDDQDNMLGASRGGQSFQDPSQTFTGGNAEKNRPMRSWWKNFGKEMLSYDIMFDALFLNQGPGGNFSLRVPLVAKIDYKGFRAIATAFIQIGVDLPPDLGFDSGKYNSTDQLKQELGYVGDCLNLKDNKTIKKQYGAVYENVPVSNFIKVHSYQSDGEGKSKDDFYSPTKQDWLKYQLEVLEYLGTPKYILKTTEIFPFDLEQTELQPNPNRFLRPELVCSNERPLKADTKKKMPRDVIVETERNQNTTSKVDKNEQNDEESHNHLGELNEASRYLRKVKISQLVELLDCMIVIPIDSASLTQVFHVQGVNMRYLGLVLQSCVSPHIREICYTEMLARTLRRLLNEQISKSIIEHQQNHESCNRELQRVQDQLGNFRNPHQQIILGSSRITNTGKQNPKHSNTELQKQKERLEEQMKDFHEDMDQQIGQWIKDFLNLVFGASEETTDFWDKVLIPEVCSYYKIEPEEIKHKDVIYNALYFAVMELTGLQCTMTDPNQASKEKENKKANKLSKKIDDLKKDRGSDLKSEENFYKNFGKSDKPFGDPYNPQENKEYTFSYIVKSQTFSLRTLPYTQLADKCREYQEKKQIQEAIDACRMKTLIKKQLIGKYADIQTIGDLCQLCLENQQWEKARYFATKALQKAHPLNAQVVKFNCILMQSFYMEDQINEADTYFSKALHVLDHHWGPFHPLHVSVYAIMAQLLISKNKYDDAAFLYQASLLCCIRVLGPNHITTGEVHMDFGKLFLKKNEKQEALQHFLEAYLIYKSYFDDNSLQTALAAKQIAILLEEGKRMKEAVKYAEIAAKAFENVYQRDNPIAMEGLWQQISINYALKDPECLKLCNKLLYSMALWDRNTNLDGQRQEHKSVDELKIKVIATIIMEITRRKSREDKRMIKAFCDKLLFHKKQEETKGDKQDETIPPLIEYHLNNIDFKRIATVGNLTFKVKQKEQLMKWYNFALRSTELDLHKDQSKFEQHYNTMIEDVVVKENNYIKKIQQQNTRQSSAANQAAGGVGDNQDDAKVIENKIFSDESQDFDQTEFFLKLIQTFDDINYYNLLVDQ